MKHVTRFQSVSQSVSQSVTQNSTHAEGTTNYELHTRGLWNMSMTNRQSLSWSRISPPLMEPLCSKACHKSGAMDPTRSQTNFSHNPLQCLLYVIRLTLFLHTFGWNLCMNFSYFSQALHASPVLTLLHHHKAHWTLDIYATTHKRSCLKIKWRHPQTLSQGQISIQSLARANNG